MGLHSNKWHKEKLGVLGEFWFERQGNRAWLQRVRDWSNYVSNDPIIALWAQNNYVRIQNGFDQDLYICSASNACQPPRSEKCSPFSFSFFFIFLIFSSSLVCLSSNAC